MARFRAIAASQPPNASGSRKRSEALHGNHEDILHEILDLDPRNARQHDPVNDASVLRIQLLQRETIAALCGVDETREVGDLKTAWLVA